MTKIENIVDAMAMIVGAESTEILGPNGLRVAPKSERQVSQIVLASQDIGACLIPMGNATRSRDTGEPVGPDKDTRPVIIIDLRRMHHILQLDRVSLTVRVQAGMAAHELERTLDQQGLSLGDIPPAALKSTVGGLLAVRTPGKSSRRHGTFEDGVLGISAVLPDGRIIHTRVAPRRASGPDLARTICGSEGTLGIVTAAVLSVHPKPESRLLAAYRLESFEHAYAATRLALREEASPSALRFYNRAAARKHFPRHDVDGAILLAATAGPTDLAACDRDLITSAVSAMGGQKITDEIAEAWWKRRFGHESPVIDGPTLEMSADSSRFLPAYRAGEKKAAALGVTMRAAGTSFDLDGGVLFITLAHSDNVLSINDDAARQVARRCQDAGAILLGSRPIVLADYLARLRSIVDPAALYNPSSFDECSAEVTEPGPEEERFL